MAARLHIDDVKHRLDGYDARLQSPEITEQLFRFGEVILQETVGRGRDIDTKATTTLGYATAALAFLLVGSGPTLMLGRARYALAVPGVLLLAATIEAYKAVRVRRWQWFHDVTWFPDPAKLRDAEHLRRNHLLDLFEVQRAISETNEHKVEHLKRAERRLVWAAWLLFGALALSLVLT